MSGEDNKEKSGLSKGEKIFIASIGVAVLILLVAGVIIGNVMPAGNVVINIDNKENETISLKENERVVIDNEYGKNVIIIRDEQVFVESADCPDKTCVKQGKIMKTGQSIVCLPHRLTVTISD